ncbi:MAG: sulfotransferase [Acidimicrobiaceae bacterium]|nr:sulfotransferase [Acidimicrobiaceae bacterium]
MHAEQLLDTAAATAGLDDFGESSFRDGLEVLVDSLNNEAKLNAIGEPAAEALLTGALVNRLTVTDYWNQHPELADQAITAPLFIVGVSRSGTTALSQLLSVDPANRSLLSWEAGTPVPPPKADTYHSDLRLLAAIEAEADNMLHLLNPDFKAMHHDPPDMPIECVTLMAHDFVSLQYNAMFNIESYADWILTRDHTATYRYHQRVLQLLQSGVPGRWQLKTPHHALAVNTIAELYPDARFIWTHRDPATCIASTASITASLSGTFSNADWTAFEGKLWTRMLTEMIERTSAARAALGDDRFIDVDYRQLASDPVGAVRGIYRDLGEPFDANFEASLAAHAKEHRQHKHGRHSYTFEDFGLNRDAINEGFADYRRTYDL